MGRADTPWSSIQLMAIHSATASRASGPLSRGAPSPSLLLSLASAVLLILAVVALSTGSAEDIDALGLISALPSLYVTSVLGMIVLFAVSIGQASLRPAALYVQVVAVAVALALAPVLIEPLTRFPTAYTHAGIMDHILRNGAVLEGYDARFSWPALFAAGALFSDVTGLPVTGLLRLSPLLLDLSYLLAFGALVSRFTTDRRRRAVALMLLVLFNWIGQDYFAPQGFAYYLYLVALTVLMCLWPAVPSNPAIAALTSRLFPRRGSDSVGSIPEPVRSGRGRLGLFAALIALYSAIVVTHQLTPVFTILTVTVLTVMGYVKSRGLFVLLFVMFLSYFEWAAVDFWSGHLDQVFGGLGRLVAALQDNFSERLPTGSSSDRGVVVYARLFMLGLLGLVAGVGLLRERRPAAVGLAVLAATPFLVLALQSYGGEALLRVGLFSLPFLCLLATYAIVPTQAGATRSTLKRVLAATLLSVLGCVVVAGFFLARYGNERFEQARPDDAAAVRELYSIAPDGAAVFAVADYLPWRYERIGELSHGELSSTVWTDGDAETRFAPMLESSGPAYLVVTGSQWDAARQLEGYSDAQVAEVKAAIASAPWLRLVYGTAECGVYEVVAE
jgi:hypothetical protein